MLSSRTMVRNWPFLSVAMTFPAQAEAAVTVPCSSVDSELNKLIDVMPGKDVARPRGRKRLASRNGECLSQHHSIQFNVWYCVNKTLIFLSQTSPTRIPWCPEQCWHYLLSDHVGGLSRVMALADEVADLLAVHYEVDAIGGQHQEAVVCVVQLQQRHMGCMTWVSAARQGNGPHGFTLLQSTFLFS